MENKISELERKILNLQYEVNLLSGSMINSMYKLTSEGAELSSPNKIRGFEPVSKKHLKEHDSQSEVILPQSGSRLSAGYDFYLTRDVTIPPGDSVFFWTDVKAYMQPGEVLLLNVRSSIGIKKGLMLSNTIGVIDADYYSNPDNDGNIGIELRNLSDKEVSLHKGERVAQGIFVNFLQADNGNTSKDRVGGIGSTGNK